MRPTQPRQAVKRKKLNFGAVVISDKVYLQKISSSEKPTKAKRVSFITHNQDIDQREEDEEEAMYDDNETDEEGEIDEVNKEGSQSLHEWLLAYWKDVSPPTEEKNIMQTWCACVYEDDRNKSHLFLGRIQKRFLSDEGSPIEYAEVLCSVKECCGQPGLFKNISDSYISKTHRLEDDMSVFRASSLICAAKMTPWQRGNALIIPSFKNFILFRKKKEKNCIKNLPKTFKLL